MAEFQEGLRIFVPFGGFILLAVWSIINFIWLVSVVDFVWGIALKEATALAISLFLNVCIFIYWLGYVSLHYPILV